MSYDLGEVIVVDEVTSTPLALVESKDVPNLEYVQSPLDELNCLFVNRYKVS